MLLVGCGGTIDNVQDSGTAGDSGLPGCNAQQIGTGNGGCNSKTMQLSGDLSKCDLGSDAAQVPQSTCEAICGGNMYSYCTFDSSNDELQCNGICVGRLPARVSTPSIAHKNAVGDWLARAAYLEAAAVDAFAILAAELGVHRAPASLRRAAHRAAADEVRHARAVGDLARSYGVEAPVPSVTRGEPLRALEEIAIENAVEGCVRETFGALVATWQATHAGNPRVRSAMKRIARDETRHAALGWRVFDWTKSELDGESASRVRSAMERAIRDLERGAQTEPNADVARELGVPRAKEATALLRAMRSELWS